MLNAGLGRLRQFWFAGDARTTLEVIRVLWALIVMADILLIWIPSFDFALLPSSPLRVKIDIVHPWNFLEGLNPTGLYVAVALLLLTLIYLTVRFNRFVMLASWLFLVCFHDLTPFMFVNYHRVLRFVGFCLIFCPRKTARTGSLSALGTVAGGRPVLRLIQLQFSMIWFYGFFYKIMNEDWQQGYAVLHILQMNVWQTSAAKALVGWDSIPVWAFRILAWSTLALEFFFSWGLFFKRTRRLALPLTIVFHTLLLLFIRAKFLQAIMFMGIAGFVDWTRVFEVLRRCRLKSRPEEDGSRSQI